MIIDYIIIDVCHHDLRQVELLDLHFQEFLVDLDVHLLLAPPVADEASS